jgi:hypothetical protein
MFSLQVIFTNLDSKRMWRSAANSKISHMRCFKRLIMCQVGWTHFVLYVLGTVRESQTDDILYLVVLLGC